MAQGEDYWREQAQSLAAQITTLKDAYGPAIDRVKQFKANFGVKERSDGQIDVDFEKFAEAIGIEGALELRKVIDEKYGISGEPGEKPHVRVSA
jgi:hypothetical protein